MLTLPGSLGLPSASAVLLQLRSSLAASPQSQVVLDASALCHFDSSAIAVVLDCRREALRLGRSFELRGAPAKLLALADLYGVRDLLGT